MRALTTSSRSALISLVAVTTLSSCQLADGPVPMEFGYRMEGGEIAVAAPLCPTGRIHGARIEIGVDGEGRGDGFETLWSASGPRSPEVRLGVFFVDSMSSFDTQEQPRSKPLPKVFYVSTRTGSAGKVTEADSGSVDLSRLKSAKLGDDEFLTYGGKVMTRKEINAQRRCKKD
ncbi:hypothetical protein [Streptomyces sp. NBC_00887]|uniref:hypothetical protein n=1 Tax=Streptomyces sp. NBC_00887 TaxID=2975859 RepID=UPI00386EABFB|nr:hypothetical protein OG844_32860 [Streptomyces sp. NBC_00887]